jgi:uncharacterized repeat protein (TIGR01451 family)
MTRWKSLWVAAALLAIGSGVARAQEQQALVMTAENLMAGDERHQALAEQGGDPNALLLGDVIRYRLLFTNVTDVPVRNVVFDNPLPDGLAYVASSAGADQAEVVVEYSIDGGATYSAQPMVEQLVDGERVMAAAAPEQYTHVRWTVPNWIEPGAQVTAEFRARLRGSDEQPGLSL